MDVKSELLASSTARLPVPQPTSRAFPFARAAANAMKSGASDRLWRPICNSYPSPLEVGKVEFWESREDCAIVMGEISNEGNPTFHFLTSTSNDYLGLVAETIVVEATTDAGI